MASRRLVLHRASVTERLTFETIRRWLKISISSSSAPARQHATRAAKASREHGARVALIERTRWGGSCPNVACRPTKAYLVAAELAYTVNELSEWMGVECGRPEVDLARVRAWKDSLRRTQGGWVEVLTDAGYEVVPGEASFTDARTVRVGDRELTAERILIATGSRTAVPAVPGIDDVDWIDHMSALELEQIPESLLVVGAGPVGLELAQIRRSAHASRSSTTVRRSPRAPTSRRPPNCRRPWWKREST